MRERNANMREMWELGLDNFHTGLFPLEEEALAKIGQQPAVILRGLIRRWMTEVLASVRRLPVGGKLDVDFHLRRGEEYIRRFVANLEKLFGTLEFAGTPVDADGFVNILLFGDGCQILMDSIINDRLRVIAHLRHIQILDEVASTPNPYLTRIHVKNLAEEDNECPVCREPIGDFDSFAISMDVCCKKLMGGDCLLTWMESHWTCPRCRHRFDIEFYKRLHLERSIGCSCTLSWVS
jgi:hypothetical protein